MLKERTSFDFKDTVQWTISDSLTLIVGYLPFTTFLALVILLRQSIFCKYLNLEAGG
jgi:hypothetical protein